MQRLANRLSVISCVESLENHRLIDDILSTKRVLNAAKNSEDVLTSSFAMIFIHCH